MISTTIMTLHSAITIHAVMLVLFVAFTEKNVIVAARKGVRVAGGCR